MKNIKNKNGKGNMKNSGKNKKGKKVVSKKMNKAAESLIMLLMLIAPTVDYIGGKAKEMIFLLMMGASSETSGKLKPYRRAVVVIDMPTKWGDRVNFINGLILTFTNNPLLQNVTPTIAQVTSDYNTFRASQAKVDNRVMGAAAERDSDFVTVQLEIYAWGAFVQMLADNDREHSVEIIEGAGFKVKHAPSFQKQDLTVKKGASTNTAKLIAKAVAKSASYDWQWSKDGVNWVNFEASTRYANNTIGGLSPAVIYYFRVRGNADKTGQWTGPVAFIFI